MSDLQKKEMTLERFLYEHQNPQAEHFLRQFQNEYIDIGSAIRTDERNRICEALLSDEVVESVADEIVGEWTYFPPTPEEWEALIKAALTAVVARIRGEV